MSTFKFGGAFAIYELILNVSIMELFIIHNTESPSNKERNYIYL